MNDTLVFDESETFTKRAIALLKEYYQKVVDIKQQLRELHSLRRKVTPPPEAPEESEIQRAEHDALFWHFHQLQPAIREFNQQVSGMIDQGQLSPLARSELRLRLAELESVLAHMTPLMHAYQPR